MGELAQELGAASDCRRARLKAEVCDGTGKRGLLSTGTGAVLHGFLGAGLLLVRLQRTRGASGRPFLSHRRVLPHGCHVSGVGPVIPVPAERTCKPVPLVPSQCLLYQAGACRNLAGSLQTTEQAMPLVIRSRGVPPDKLKEL